MQYSMSRHRNEEFKTKICCNFDMIKYNTDSSRLCEKELKILFMKMLFFKKFHGSNTWGCELFVSGNFGTYSIGIGIRKSDFLPRLPQHCWVTVAIFRECIHSVHSSFSYSY